jgi:hypothetical protein
MNDSQIGMTMVNGFQTNQLLRLVLLLGTFFSANIFAMRMTEKGTIAVKRWTGQSQKEEALSKKRGLLIFLDEQEKDVIGSITSNLLLALYQEAGPIILSASLLYSLREYARKDNRPIEELLNQLGQEQLQLEQTKSVLNAALIKICFKQERWIIKKINNSLNLCIPLRHLDSLNIVYDTVKKIDSTMETNTVSNIELQLGLKVNHMETVDFGSIEIPSYYTQVSTYFSSTLASYFVDALDIIFCKKSDYINELVAIPQWCMFIEGHGLTNVGIAYLTLDDFKKLLNFFEKEMIITLLVVFSCYAAGVNANKIYGELKLGTQQYYSFPIILQGFNDIPSRGSYVNIDLADWRNNKKISLYKGISFIDFLEKSQHVEGNYSEIIKPISSNYIQNTPQIKLPGLEWFSVMDVEKKIVAIGATLAQTRDPQQPLNIGSYFKKDPEAVLLYTDNIPFELVLSSKGNAKICSMVSSGPMRNNPEFVIHRIKKISGKNLYGSILSRFMVEGTKWFFIDEINEDNTIYKDVLLFVASKERDYFFGTQITCYFKDKNNVLFKKELWKYTDAVQAGLWDKWDYESKMDEVRKYLELSGNKLAITPEHIKKMEDVLTEQPAERQKKLLEAYTVSEPEVD